MVKEIIIVRPKQNASGDGFTAELKSDPGHWEFSKQGPEDVFRELIYSLNFKVDDVPRDHQYDNFDNFVSAFIQYKQNIISANYIKYERQDADYEHYIDPSVARLVAALRH